MKITGHCHCQAIAFEAEVEPGTMSICHCTDCQRLCGSAFRTSIPSLPDTFRLLRGTPKVYIKRTADSGAHRAQGFCAECGSQIYSAPTVDPHVYMIRTGIIEERAQLAPGKQIWCRSAMPWLTQLDAVPRAERQS